MQVIANDADISTGVAHLCKVEPRFERVLLSHGMPPLRLMEPGLRGLLMIIVEQLISLKAAAAIWARIEAKLPGFDAAHILDKSEDDLRALGLTGAKARAFRGVAMAIHEGRLDFGGFATKSNDEIYRDLCALSGIGPWTANIYLLSALGRADAWPAGDLALQLAAQDLFGLAQRPTVRDLDVLAADWTPYRAIAARLLWSHYRGLKGMKQTVD